jgi:hypothetical protein
LIKSRATQEEEAGMGPRSITNMVFVLLLAAALGVAGLLTWEMFQAAMNGSA